MDRGLENSKPIILVADDIPENIELMEAHLHSIECTIIPATDGQDALQKALDNNPDLLLLDVMMPGLTGIQVCGQLRKVRKFRFTPIVMVTSLSDVQDKVAAIEAGATDFLTKPVNRLELITRVNTLLNQKSLYDDLASSYDIIFALVSVVEARDTYTHGHSERVGTLAAEFARFLSMDEVEVERIHKAGLLHDIGKIGISDSILNKPGRLTQEEYNIILDHPIIGAKLISNIKNLRDVSQYIRHHHERYDGYGHPDRLSGDSIPMGARIIGIADTYDAIISRRSYDAERSEDDAVMIFKEERDHGQWDPELVDRFLEFLAVRSGEILSGLSGIAQNAPSELSASSQAAEG